MHCCQFSALKFGKKLLQHRQPNGIEPFKRSSEWKIRVKVKQNFQVINIYHSWKVDYQFMGKIIRYDGISPIDVSHTYKFYVGTCNRHQLVAGPNKPIPKQKSRYIA